MRLRFALFVGTAALVLILSSLPRYSAEAQPGSLASTPGRLVELRALPADSFTRVAPRKGAGGPRLQTATINVTYTGFSPEARAAFEYAVTIWEGLIISSVPIEVDARWTPLGSGILGSAGATNYWVGVPNAPFANTWYPSALAGKILGTDVEPGVSDITANFNSTYSNWYYGTDGNTPQGKYDLVSVVLHEIGHGLGFVGSMAVDSGLGSWGLGSGFPFIYDRFAVNGAGQLLISAFPNGSAALAAQLTGGSLYANGSSGFTGACGERPRLYAPPVWSRGSSYAHLDEATYPAGDPDSLMTYAIGAAEAIHDPGTIALGMFADMGWAVDGSLTRNCPTTGTPTSTSTSTPTGTPTSTPTSTTTPTATQELPELPNDFFLPLLGK